MSVPSRDYRPPWFCETMYLQKKRSILQELVWDTNVIAISFLGGTNMATEVTREISKTI